MERIITVVPHYRDSAVAHDAKHPLNIFLRGAHDAPSAISEGTSTARQDIGTRATTAFNAAVFASMPALSKRAHTDNSPLAKHENGQKRRKKGKVL
jgi:hypothetical protein